MAPLEGGAMLLKVSELDRRELADGGREEWRLLALGGTTRRLW